MDETDIWRTARLVITRYGADAAFHAATRADGLLNKGDTEGAAVWRKIVQAVHFLQDPERPTMTEQ